MPILASLPWYDLPADTQALDRLWAAVRYRLGAHLPAQLERHRPIGMQWQHPRLVLSQCCGPDLLEQPQLEVLARPAFSELDCEPGRYYSHLVVRRGFRGTPKRAAINSPSSRSGCLALKEWLQHEGLAQLSFVESGAHVTSLEWLQQGKVDIVAIDAHTWNRLGIRGFDIIGRSDTALTPPYVMHRSAPIDKEAMLAALGESIAEQGLDVGVSALVDTERGEYQQPACCASRQMLSGLTMAKAGNG